MIVQLISNPSLADCWFGSAEIYGKVVGRKYRQTFGLRN